MKHKNTMLSAAVVLFGFGGLNAQESPMAAGSEATGTGGTASYSVGQLAYTTATGTNGSVAQGVQQAYQIISGINESDLQISLSVFPNPTAYNLSLAIKDFNNEQLSYQLLDMSGKLLDNDKVAAEHTVINTASLAPATYYINVVDQDNKKIETFKIIKQ